MALGMPATQFCVADNHASTHLVSYSLWSSVEAQLTAGIKSAKALSNALWLADLSSHQDGFFDTLAGDPIISYVHHGHDALVISSILVLSFCHTSYMMPSLLIVHGQALERAMTEDKAAKLERCTLGGATDIKPETREDPDTRAKFIAVNLDPDTDSKCQRHPQVKQFT
jgi:hypothetical protein